MVRPKDDPKIGLPLIPVGGSRMARRNAVRSHVLITAGCLLLLITPVSAQNQESFENVVSRYVYAMKPDSGVPASEKIDIIAFFEKHFTGTDSGMISSVLFNACNVNMEPDHKVREAAARALGSVCNLENIMYVHRLVRVTDPDKEPAPPVRMAALKSLARSSRSSAADRIRLSARAGGDPDPDVQRFAQKLLQENPRLVQ